MRRYAAEAIGTFFLSFVITCTALLNVALAPFAIAAVLTVMVFAGGHVSGAHYNPAVTTALAVRGRFAWRDVPVYWAAQTVGALAGALVARLAVARHAAHSAFTVTGPSLAAAAAAELLFTFALAYVVLNVAASRHTAGNSFYGLAIGSTVLTGALTVGSVSGGVFNPAVALALASAGILAWKIVPIYLVVQLLSGASAGLVFRALNRDDITEPTPTGETVADEPEVAAQLTKIASNVEALTTAFRDLPQPAHPALTPERAHTHTAAATPGAVRS
jgi:aquaporin Z